MRKLLTSPGYICNYFASSVWAKWLFLLFILTGTATIGLAQPGLTLYNMPFVPSAHHYNPANTPLSKVYVSLPGLSGGAFNLQNNMISLKDVGVRYGDFFNAEEVIDAQGSGILDKMVSMAQIRNQFTGSAEVNLFGVGIRAKRHFFSFSIQDRFHSYGNIPEDFIRLMDAEDDEFPESEVSFNLSDFRLSAMHYRPYTLSYAYDILPNLTVGVRASYISGLGHGSLESNNLMITTNGSTLGFEAGSSLSLLSSSWFLENETFDGADYLLRPANHGLAFGGGIRYFLENERIELMMSVSDIGYINWKENVHTNEYNQTFIKSDTGMYESFERVFTEAQFAPNETYRTRLASNFFFGGNYYFQGPSSIGFLVRTSNMESSLKTAFALTFNTTVEKWLGFSLGYNTNGASHHLGTGLAINMGPVQWHVVSDNVLFFLSAGGSRNAQLGTGINLVFGTKEREEPWWDPNAVDTPLLGTEADSSMLKITQGPKEETFIDTVTVEDPIYESGIPAKPEEIEPEPITIEESARVPKERTYFITSDVPLYAAPNADSSVVAIINFGDSLKIQSDFLHFWEKVTFRDTVGYLKTVFLATTEEWESIPVNTGKDYFVRSIKDDTSPAQGEYKVTKATSLRLGPSHTRGVILRLYEGYEIELLEKTNNLWWKVRYRGESGYAKAALMQSLSGEALMEKEPAAAPQTPPVTELESTETTGAGQMLYMTKATSLREQPSGGAAVILRFEAGDAVQVIEKTNEWWWKVSYQGNVGYAKAHLMSSDKK